MTEQAHPLPFALATAVPLIIAELRAEGGPAKDHVIRAQSYAQEIAERGDVLLFGSTKKNETAELFTHVAEAIVILAFVPGGIKIFGQHFEAGEND